MGIRCVSSTSPLSVPPLLGRPFSDKDDEMARNRMTFEKHQRDAKKKQKAEEKRAMKLKKKEPQVAPELAVEAPPVDESVDG